MENYRILKSRTIEGLNKKVNELITSDGGWKPKGSHSVITTIAQNQYSGNQFMRTLYENEYAQTMIKSRDSSN